MEQVLNLNRKLLVTPKTFIHQWAYLGRQIVIIAHNVQSLVMFFSIQ